MPIRSLPRPLALALALAAPLAGGAAAQSHHGAIGYGAGGAWFSPFNPGSDARALDLDAGWIVSAHLDQWLGAGRFGARLSGAYSQRPLDGAAERRDIDLWTASAAALVRLLPADPARRLAPFLALGAGVVDYDLGEGAPVVFPEAETIYLGEGERQAAGVIGLGVDLFPGLAWHEVPVGIRVELTDHVTRESPFSRVGGDRYGPVHNLTLTIGIHGLR